MDWILLAVAIALLVVAVYSESHTTKKKKQSAVYLGDSALFTITSSLRAPLRRAVRDFPAWAIKIPPSLLLKPLRNALMISEAVNRYAADCQASGFSLNSNPTPKRVSFTLPETVNGGQFIATVRPCRRSRKTHCQHVQEGGDVQMAQRMELT